MAIHEEIDPRFVSSEPLGEREYKWSLTLRQRFGLYDFADPWVDPNRVVLEGLDLAGHESVFDLGCGPGDLLLALRAGDHSGSLVGMDSSIGMLQSAAMEAQKHKLHGVDFIRGNAEHLEHIEDDSFDVSMALFMLYHCADPEKVIRELQRITKPGGTIVISTSGSKNKYWHRWFEAKIAERLTEMHDARATSDEERVIYKAHEPFNKPFDSDIADEMLPRLFLPQSVTKAKPQRARIYLDDTPENKDAREAYAFSLLSMKETMDPMPSMAKWEEAIEVVWQKIDHEHIRGFFEVVERDYYFCRNDPSPPKELGATALALV